MDMRLGVIVIVFEGFIGQEGESRFFGKNRKVRELYLVAEGTFPLTPV
jgi:hypothetical protein